ncbi:MAG: hypothetical protein IT437_09820 [Phycisphaerales bacterium]|nr:hypothetical protein [Phycisphaerales bacterium]
MWRQIQTYAVVTVVTLLIWMLAESEGVRTATLRLTVDLSPEPGSRVLEVLPRQVFGNAVTVTMSGPVAKIDSLTRELRETLHLAAGIPNDAGEHTVDMRAALMAYPTIRDSGVTITDADPPTVMVYVDHLVAKEARVVVKVPEGSLAAPPTPAQATVTLKVPSRLQTRLPSPLEVTAPISQAVLDALPDGKFVSVPDVTLVAPEGLRGLPGSDFVTIEPPTISVGLTPASSEVNQTLPTVPVQLLIPPVELDKWIITLDPSDLSIQDVSVTGPADLVRQVVDKTLRVVAVVQPTFGELENAARTGQPLVKEALFSVFPPLPGPLRLEAADRSVSLTVKARP